MTSTASGSSAPVAMIPARGGSKRLYRKNVHPFFGRPLIAWTIEAAHASGLFSTVYVSTEDPLIADVARAEGAAILERRGDLASDRAGLIDVVRDAIATTPGWPDTFAMLLPNCPLRTAGDILEAHNLFRSAAPPALLSVTDFSWTPPFRALYETPAGLSFAIPEIGQRKSQDYPDTLCPSGAIYMARTLDLRDADTLYVPGLRPFRMPWPRAVDIDTEADLRLAACLRHAETTGFSFEDRVT